MLYWLQRYACAVAMFPVPTTPGITDAYQADDQTEHGEFTCMIIPPQRAKAGTHRTHPHVFTHVHVRARVLA